MTTRIFTIGDVHGCLTELNALFDAILPTVADRIILLGDLVDRGSDSAGVIARVIELSKTNHVTTIKGNHEQMLLEARTSADKLTDWLSNGGDATLRSYGAGATLADVPAEHLHFLEHQLVDYFETETHILVHANAYPDMAMTHQPDYMLRWERCDEIAPHESGKTIVCGHTPQKSGAPMNKGYAICIDTDACRGGWLTCLELNAGTVWRAQRGQTVRKSHITDF
jgi:serine/threonine protein phosphatase 1